MAESDDLIKTLTAHVSSLGTLGDAYADPVFQACLRGARDGVRYTDELVRSDADAARSTGNRDLADMLDRLLDVPQDERSLILTEVADSVRIELASPGSTFA